MQYSFSKTPNLSRQVFDLLDVVFPGVRRVAQQARTLGAAWESVSTPFIRFEDGRIVCHVGVIELSLVLLGQPVTVGSIHGVATHPQCRRRGYYREIMEEVLQYCDTRYETLVLTTEHPEYFESFGFRVVQEHFFRLQVETTGGSDGLPEIDLGDTKNVSLLHRLLETRELVSNIVGVVNEKAVFCFNEGSNPLHCMADLDTLLCLEMEGTQLKLFDVVGPQVPPLAALLERLPRGIDEICICFSPDRIAAGAEPVPYVFDHDGPTYLMVRGPFAAEGHAFSLPRSART